MRAFFRSLLCRKHKPPSTQNNTQSRAMSSGMAAAIAYACTMTPPSALGAVPEDSKEKAHHLKGGKGFQNPWPSWIDQNPMKIGGAVAWYVGHFLGCLASKSFNISFSPIFIHFGRSNYFPKPLE